MGKSEDNKVNLKKALTSTSVPNPMKVAEQSVTVKMPKIKKPATTLGKSEDNSKVKHPNLIKLKAFLTKNK